MREEWWSREVVRGRRREERWEENWERDLVLGVVGEVVMVLRCLEIISWMIWERTSMALGVDFWWIFGGGAVDSSSFWSLSLSSLGLGLGLASSGVRKERREEWERRWTVMTTWLFLSEVDRDALVDGFLDEVDLVFREGLLLVLVVVGGGLLGICSGRFSLFASP